MGFIVTIISIILLSSESCLASILQPLGHPVLKQHQLVTMWSLQTVEPDHVNVPGLCRKVSIHNNVKKVQKDLILFRQLHLHVIEKNWRGQVSRTDCGLAG